MIEGIVRNNGEPVVPLKVLGSEGRTVELQVIVDTGFSAFLALPRAVVVMLELQDPRYVPLSLADGSTTQVPSYVVEVGWLARRRRVIAVEIDGPALIGMEMMFGCRLSVDVALSGRVAIERLE